MESALIRVISNSVLSKTVSDTIDTLYTLKNSSIDTLSVLESLDITVKLEIIHAFLSENYSEMDKSVPQSHTINLVIKHINNKIQDINEILRNLSEAMKEYENSSYLMSGQSTLKKQQCLDRLSVHVSVLDERFSVLLKLARI